MDSLRWQSLLGLLVFTGLAWALSDNRRAITGRILGRTVVAGLGLQLVLAAVLLHVPGTERAFIWLNNVLLALEGATEAGTRFVFGYLGGGETPFEVAKPQHTYILAFRALPLVLVTSALSALLYHWRVLPLLVKAFARVLARTLDVGGAVGVNAAANVFVGMVEAPLYVRPYLSRLSRGELFMVMSCGMATVAGTVLVLYASILRPVMPDALGQILIASVVSAPAAIMVARLMVPPEGDPTSADLSRDAVEGETTMHAVARGTSDGLQVLLNIVAFVIVLIALVHLANSLLQGVFGESITLQGLLGIAMRPVAWLLGVPWQEAAAAGDLIGTKVVLNELMAYQELAGLAEAGTLGDRSVRLLTYALCGFANFGSLGIMVGGLSAMAPDRRHDVVTLGPRSIVAGLLATCLTGSVVGLIG